MARGAGFVLLPPAIVSLLWAAALVHRTGVDEVEPNDSAVVATPVILGDTARGVIADAIDVDFFAIDLTAGTLLDVWADAGRIGSPLDPFIALFDVDGVTFLQVNDDAYGLDSRIVYEISATGTYFVAVTSATADGGPSHRYELRFGQAVLADVEPNDTPANAGALTVGDTVLGVVDGSTDVDVFVTNVPAGVRFTATLDPAFASFTPQLRLFAADGMTLLDARTGKGVVGRVETFTSSAGPLYVAVGNVGTGNGGVYALTAGVASPGPGDPTTLAWRVPGGLPSDIAAGADGVLYVRFAAGQSVRRLEPSGSQTILATDMERGSGMVVDGFGDLLFGSSVNGGRILRLRRSGGRDVFTADVEDPMTLTVGPDGDVWAVDCTAAACPELRRFDPLGAPLERRTLPLASPAAIAFAADGVLHYRDEYGRVYRIGAGGAVSLVLTADPGGNGLAFDRDGYLYVGNGEAWTVDLYDPAYAPVHQPFAITGLRGASRLVFGRQADGAMTARLFATAQVPRVGDASFDGGVLELNPAGVRAPGLQVGVDLFRLVTVPLDTGLLGFAYADTLPLGAPSRQGVVWTVTGGALPPGLALRSATGVIEGVAEGTGTFTVTVRAERDTDLAAADFMVTVREPVVAEQRVMDGLLGDLQALVAGERRFLDLIGNRNLRFDAGDARAFLRLQGALPAAAPGQPTARRGNR